MPTPRTLSSRACFGRQLHRFDPSEVGSSKLSFLDPGVRALCSGAMVLDQVPLMLWGYGAGSAYALGLWCWIRSRCLLSYEVPMLLPVRCPLSYEFPILLHCPSRPGPSARRPLSKSHAKPMKSDANPSKSNDNLMQYIQIQCTSKRPAGPQPRWSRRPLRVSSEWYVAGCK